MKKVFYLVMCFSMALLIVSMANAELLNVTVGKGDLKVGGIFKARFTKYFEDEDAGAQVPDGFTLNNARFLLWGSIVPDKIKYFVQTDFVGDSKTAGFKDIKMIFDNYIPKTSINVGRFLPKYGAYMYENIGKLDFINYPLVEFGYNFAEGNPLELVGYPGFAMWRDTGIMTQTVTDYVDFNFGIFNGPGYLTDKLTTNSKGNTVTQITYPNSNNISDNNDAKDIFLRADIKPIEGLTVSGFGWLGNALLADDDDLKYNSFGGVLEYKWQALKVLGEYLMGTLENPTEGEDDYKMAGYFAQAQYKVTNEVEVLGRYDALDPDTDSESDEDAMNIITLGLNYYFESYNAMISTNYRIIGEQWDWPSDNDYATDEFILQLQIMF